MTAQTNSHIKEGKAVINKTTNVFYNPAQMINRDLSVLVMNEHKGKTILDALSATGLRAIRYHKELDNVQVVANDVDVDAIKMIKDNLKLNDISEIKNMDKLRDVLKEYEIENTDMNELLNKEQSPNGIEITHQDAANISRQFDIIDLDPYGTASPFIESAVKNIKKGGLLCITCTDMQTLAGGKAPESNFMKYSGMGSHSDFSHEHALRLVLKSVTDSASRYKKAIVPLLCVSIDFYIRLFVRVESSAVLAKDACANTGLCFLCTRCKWYAFQPFATKNVKCKYFPATLSVSKECPECEHDLQISGPVYLGPIHDKPFINNLVTELNNKESKLKFDPVISKRILGILTALTEEVDAPLYLRMKGLGKVWRGQMPKTIKVRNAIFNAGYNASPSHIGGDCIKTDMPLSKVYDIYRAFFKSIDFQPQPETLSFKLMQKSVDWEVSFAHHASALVDKKHPRYMHTSNAPLSKPKKRDLEDQTEEALKTKIPKIEEEQIKNEEQ